MTRFSSLALALPLALATLLAAAPPAAAQSCSGNTYVRLYTAPEAGEVRPGQIIEAQTVVFDAYGRQLRCDVRWSVSGGRLLEQSFNYARIQVGSGPGRVYIRVSTFGGRQDDYRTFNITSAPLVLEVQPDSVTLRPGEEKQLEMVLTDAAGGEYVVQEPGWVSSDPAVATVDARGMVHAVAPGEARIRGTYRPREGGEARTAEGVVKVVPKT